MNNEQREKWLDDVDASDRVREHIARELAGFSAGRYQRRSIGRFTTTARRSGCNTRVVPAVATATTTVDIKRNAMIKINATAPRYSARKVPTSPAEIKQFDEQSLRLGILFRVKEYLDDCPETLSERNFMASILPPQISRRVRTDGCHRPNPRLRVRRR